MSANDLFHIKSKSVTTTLSVESLRFSQIYFLAICLFHTLDVDAYTDVYIQNMNEYIQTNYIEKLVNTISYLSKEDLADMAESLVRMTYLKRRITSEEESVGGPVDVAVITKGDGFIWLKRKHYFSPELNHHYFER